MNVVRPAQMLANHAIVPVSARGFSMFTEPGGHLLADLAGYFIGAPAAAPFGPRTNPTAPACSTRTAGEPVAPVGPIVNGSSRTAVANLQNRLLQLGFWNAGADGGYGLTTTQSVMAFQKWKGLPATTVVDTATAIALNTERCFPAAGGRSGDYFEVDKGKQIAFVVRGGKVQHVFNVSTGNGKSYDEEDQKNAGNRVIGVAITPTGTFQDVPRARRRQVRGRPRHAVPTEVRHRRRRRPRRSEGAELSGITRLHPRGQPGHGPDLGPEPAAAAIHRVDPRLSWSGAPASRVCRWRRHPWKPVTANVIATSGATMSVAGPTTSAALNRWRRAPDTRRTRRRRRSGRTLPTA